MGKISWLCALLVMALTTSKGAQAQERRLSQPAFSPDAKKLVYVENFYPKGEILTPSAGEIWTVNLDGSEAKHLTAGQVDEEPRFSPDDEWLVFHRQRDVWMVGVDGTGERQVTHTPTSSETGAAFTNDGKGLLFVRNFNDDVPADKITTLPILAAAAGVVPYSEAIYRNLSDGAERKILGAEYQVEQIAPDMADPNLALVLCLRLDANNQPLPPKDLENIVATVNLKSSAIRPVYSSKVGAQRTIDKLRPSTGQILLAVTDKVTETATVLLSAKRPTTLPQIALPEDVSPDGRLIATVGYDPKTGASPLEIYDISTKQSRFLPLPPSFQTFKGVSPQAVVPPPAAPAGVPPANPDYVALGRESLKIGATGDALEAFDHAIERDPKNPEAFYYRGLTLLARLEGEDATTAFDKALQLKPDYVAALTGRGDALTMQMAYPEALADYNRAIELQPRSAFNYGKRARLHRKMGHPELAEADEKKAKDLIEF